MKKTSLLLLMGNMLKNHLQTMARESRSIDEKRETRVRFPQAQVCNTNHQTMSGLTIKYY